uniref:F-box domain-containing protein n=1 Tax=Caenorhabditis tropicalis TaxID=1561998 RepID=A0A1I7UIA0_9PELO
MDLHNRLAGVDQKKFYDLPFDVIEKIVEYLDFESQMKLRRVCHGLKNIMDQVKPPIDRLKCDFNYPKTANLFYASKYYKRFQYYNGENCKERAFNAMEIILSNPRLRLDSFECGEYSFDLSGDDHKLIEQLNALNHQLEITEITMRHLKTETMIALLKATKPGTLEEVRITEWIKPEDIDKLAELDQWKQAKRLRIDTYLADFSRQSQNFHHFEFIQCRVGEISVDDLMAMKNSFIMCIMGLPMPTEIDKVLGLTQVTFPYIGRFKIPNSNEFLEFTFLPLMRLRTLSRALQNIVDQVKPTIDHLRYDFNYHRMVIINCVSRYSSCHNSYIGENYKNKAFNDMKIILSNPKLRLESFIYYNQEFHEDHQKLIELLNSLNHKLEITKLVISQPRNERVMDILKAIKTGTLEELIIRCFPHEIINIDGLVDLDQWKQAKTLTIVGVFPDFSHQFHHFRHFESLELSVNDISINAMMDMKTAFSENPNFDRCIIRPTIRPPTSVIKEQLGLTDVSHGTGFYIGRWNIPDSEDHLEFLVSKSAIYTPMSKFLDNHPTALEALILYDIEKWRTADRSYRNLCELIGEDAISEEDFEELYRKLIKGKKTHPLDLRLCILSDVIERKSSSQSFIDTNKIIRSKDIDYQEFKFWFDTLFYGSRDLDQKTFSDLPFETISIIVEFLDFKSQARLRQVSHGLRNIVDRVKPSVQHLSFSFYTSGGINSFSISYGLNYRGFYDVAFWSTRYDGENEGVLKDLEILLRNPKLQLDSLHLGNQTDAEKDEKLIDMVNSLNHKLKVTRFETGFIKTEKLIASLKSVKPGTLEEISFKIDEPMSSIDRLAKLEQWKQAKHVEVYSVHTDFFPNFHHFHHFESLRTSVKSISMNDLLTMRNVYSENVNFKHCSIKVTNKPLTRVIEERLGLAELREENHVMFEFNFDFFLRGRSSYFGRYNIPDSKDYLLFDIDKFGIKVRRKSA